MDFSEPARRPRGESIVPMINVVFLLLIFFLMTSRLTQPTPFEVTPPVANSDQEPVSEHILFVDKTGLLHFDGVENEAAIARLAARNTDAQVIKLKASLDLEAVKLAQILRALSEAGLERVELVVSRK